MCKGWILDPVRTTLNMEGRLECALKSLLNIAEDGGYLKNDKKENIRHAMSVIRKCFLKMKCAFTQ